MRSWLHITKAFAVSALLIALLAQVLSSPLVMADYYLNTGKYAANCVNKERPVMKCQGKCQMMKKLAEEEEKQQENSDNTSIKSFDYNLSSKSFFADALDPLATIAMANFNTPADEGAAIHRPRAIFHPPAV